VDSKVQGYRENPNGFTGIVAVSYRTHFSKGDGVETWIYRVNGKEAKLAGYYINSELLKAG
jgi:hypothetical protein